MINEQSGGAHNDIKKSNHNKNGEKLKSTDGVLSLQQIIDIDWLLESIEGEIPKYEVLSEEGRETVKNGGAAKAETRGE